MSLLRNKQVTSIREVENVSDDEPFRLENDWDLSEPIIHIKFNLSIERNIERSFLESKQLGLSYSRFVACVLEALIVLNHRKDAT
jgi:hypothetical protein